MCIGNNSLMSSPGATYNLTCVKGVTELQKIKLWGAYVLGGICPGGKCPGGKCPGVNVQAGLSCHRLEHIYQVGVSLTML